MAIEYTDEWGIPALKLVRVGLRTDADIKCLMGWTQDQWTAKAMADDRVKECYDRRDVSDARRRSEIRAIAYMVWEPKNG